MRISFCLITLNEAEYLPRALQSCADLADEIVVVDSGSTDATEEIARRFGARWQHQDWLGYVGQKNKMLSLATQEWVFSLDGDEELSPALREEIRRLKHTNPEPDISAFRVTRCMFYEGHWIRHGGWYPDWLPRLFRRERARFAGGRVHERIELTGKIKTLRGDLYHYSYRDAADHWARCQKYAHLWAETQHENGRTVTALAPYTHAAFRWVRDYGLKRGFLDGRLGWRIAGMAARDVFFKYQLLRGLQTSAPLRRVD